VDAIVLSPLDNAALVKSVKSATDKRIPIVIIDSALNGTPGKDFNSYVATNNGKAGELAAQRLIKLLGGKGKVVMMRYLEGSASTAEREEGFLKVMKQNPGISILVDNRYAGATVDEAKTSAMNMVDQLKNADGIFTPNEPSTFGMALALRQARLNGQVKFVGFDASPSLLEALEKGDINALVVQNPEKMGYDGVKTAVAVIKGEKVPPVIDTGVAVVDKDNLKTPEIEKLLGKNS
jgi:ribose transport system substrate-binding protein